MPSPSIAAHQPDGTASPEPSSLRGELLRRAAVQFERRAPALALRAGGLLAELYRALPEAELAQELPEAMADAVASLYDFAQARAPGETKLRVRPPGHGQTFAVAEIVTDDKPFLVATALAGLSLQGRTILRLLHPVLRVTRDETGQVTDLRPARAAAADGAPGCIESFMRIEVSPAPTSLLGETAPPTGDWRAMEAVLTQGMDELRCAVDDFRPMLDRLAQAAAASTDAEERDFLLWMAADNFILLGSRSDDPAEPGLGLFRGAPEVGAEGAPGRLTVGKASTRSRVYRPGFMDLISVRTAAGAQSFAGFFASAAYSRNPRSIPLLSSKVLRVIALGGAAARSHDERALRYALDTWPRDELFQASEADILAGARRAMELQIRPRTALVLRADPSRRFVTAIAWLPHDSYDTRRRLAVGRLLVAAFNGRLASTSLALGDEPLARVYYVIATEPGHVPPVDVQALEQAVAQAVRPFSERLTHALAEEMGSSSAAELQARWSQAFPPAYRESTTIAQAVADLRLAERAAADRRACARLDHVPGETARRLVLRLVNPGQPLPLADALPLFEALDLRAIEETPYRLTPAGGEALVLHVFSLEAGTDVTADRYPALLAGLDALLARQAEADGFNRLVLRAGLDWRECWLLRAMYRWLKQVGFTFSQEAVASALAEEPHAARLLVDLFLLRFDPVRPPDPAGEAALEAAWTQMLTGVADPDTDRILIRLRTLLDAILRTNYFQLHDRLVFKIDSAQAGPMPAPRPWREIFVHAAHMEGCHLRAGPVARGGIRWSDRREDFRTEILGLMKAQRLKNVVIVPTGAKGGFVLKGAIPPPSDREGLLAAGHAAYRSLVRGMLDVTDNLHGAEIVPPQRVVRRDGNDPYIVAAADKGTATFSDLANSLSAETGFWLGDAFASGGSQGYDHKAMGITAKGAWVMIAAHFAEMGRDIQSAAFTCAGVGDMSGDVFGNGLLISRQTRLVAAFDHRHIFLDPDPDAAASYLERARMYALPRSSWADYDPACISAGGGVFPRHAKTMKLSAEAQALLGIAADTAEPAAVMRAILGLDVDLLYFGGIGTYVKASTEVPSEAGDRANDALRVDGAALRARVLGEGANLAITQAGRIEAAAAGVRLNTDALDNSAGVSTSDHEVNIKILLADVMAAGLLTLQGRDLLLAEMTEALGRLVLAENADQFLAVSLELAPGAALLPCHAALMTRLEAAGLLDRAVAGLPPAGAMAARVAAGQRLSRPEVATLLPVAKLWLTESLEGSALLDDPALLPLLTSYFPPPLPVRFAAQVARHRLRRELIGTRLVNFVADRIGPAGLARLTEDAGPEAVMRAAWLADALFGIGAAVTALRDSPAPWERRCQALLALRALQEAGTSGLLAGPEMRLSLGDALDALRPGVAVLIAAVPVEALDPVLPLGAARLAAAVPSLMPALGVLRLAADAGVSPQVAAAAWARTGAALALGLLQDATGLLPGTAPFAARARGDALEELAGAQARLARVMVRDGALPEGAEAVAATVREAVVAPDFASVSVALRALSRLIAAGDGGGVAGR